MKLFRFVKINFQKRSTRMAAVRACAFVALVLFASMGTDGVQGDPPGPKTAPSAPSGGRQAAYRAVGWLAGTQELVEVESKVSGPAKPHKPNVAPAATPLAAAREMPPGRARRQAHCEGGRTYVVVQTARNLLLHARWIALYPIIVGRLRELTPIQTQFGVPAGGGPGFGEAERGR